VAVNSFPEGASWCGTLGLTGNAWEWCADWYADDYYRSSPPRNPPGPEAGALRVLRGGGWDGDPYLCRSALRLPVSLGYSNSLYGFRCVASPRSR
jgi:formylglycine-generating enzyme required for sulfatase activity